MGPGDWGIDGGRCQRCSDDELVELEDGWDGR